MTRIALLSDVHGNLAALEAVTKEIRREKPDAVLVAGDLVLNGPEPNATVDALRVLESEGALIVSGNTDIAVGDFDYGSAFPHYQDGVPDTVTAAAEWAHDELGDDQLEWLRRLPAERRLRTARPLRMRRAARPRTRRRPLRRLPRRAASRRTGIRSRPTRRRWRRRARISRARSASHRLAGAGATSVSTSAVAPRR